MICKGNLIAKHNCLDVVNWPNHLMVIKVIKYTKAKSQWNSQSGFKFQKKKQHECNTIVAFSLNCKPEIGNVCNVVIFIYLFIYLLSSKQNYSVAHHLIVGAEG